MTSNNRVSVIVFVEFWRNKLFMFTDEGLVILDQRSYGAPSVKMLFTE